MRVFMGVTFATLFGPALAARTGGGLYGIEMLQKILHLS
jgi:hypothetical protein